MRIGILGGSFDPPHEGHRMVALLALRRLALDSVWWLVTPGNPLKQTAPADLGRRLSAAAALADHPQMAVTGVETTLGTRFTAETLAAIAARLPSVRLVWLMGADNLVSFHRWHDWQRIAALVPMAVVDRPGASLVATDSPAAHALRRWRIPESEARQLPVMAPPAWVFLHGPRLPISSSAIRTRTASGVSS